MILKNEKDLLNSKTIYNKLFKKSKKYLYKKRMDQIDSILT